MARMVGPIARRVGAPTMVADSPEFDDANGDVGAWARTLTTSPMMAPAVPVAVALMTTARGSGGSCASRASAAGTAGGVFSCAEVPVEFVGVVAAQFGAVVGDPVGQHDLAGRGGVGIGEAIGHRLVFLTS
jgi:hypothetical protein